MQQKQEAENNGTQPLKVNKITQNARVNIQRKCNKDARKERCKRPQKMMGSKENADCWLGGWLGENN